MILGTIKPMLAHQWSNSHYVYAYSLDGVIIYVGYGRHVAAMDFRAVKHLRKWIELTEGKELFITFVEAHGREHDAKMSCAKHVFRLKPVVNYDKETVVYRNIVTCVETGEQFRNAAEAARKFDIRPGNMSNHLNNIPGFRTLKGYTFKRGL